jgi:hypothetical protein
MVTLRSLLTGLALGASSLVSAQGFDWSECDTPDFTMLDGDGNGGGGGFCASQWKQGILINSIRAKADGLSLRGLRIGFTDNTFVEVGAQWSTDGREGTVSWDPLKDRIISIETWATGWANGLGRLVMETSNGQRFDAGNNHSGHMGKSLNRGSGMLIGVRGRHGGTGGAIDNLEFIFAKSNPRSYELRDMSLSPSIDEINQRASNGDRGLKVDSLAVVHFVNKTPNEMTAGLEGTREKKVSTSFTQSRGTTFGLGVGFEVSTTIGIPEVADVTATLSTQFNWEERQDQSTTKGTEINNVLKYSGQTTLDPNSAARCSAFSLTGNLEVKWLATNVVVFEDNTEWHYHSEGEHQTVESTEAWVVCEPEELTAAEDAKANGERVEDPRTVSLGGPALQSRRQMGPVKRLSAKKE